MNTPKATKGQLQPDELRSVPSMSGAVAMTIMPEIARFATGYYREPVMQVSKPTAIAWAKEILIAYGVPFCNRVSEKGGSDAA